MASEQCVIVGVISTSTVERSRVRGAIWMSGRLTTAREPRERGCSGSEIVEMRSEWMYELESYFNKGIRFGYRKFPARLLARSCHCRCLNRMRKWWIRMDRSDMWMMVQYW